MGAKYFIAIKTPQALAESLQPVMKKLKIHADRHETQVRWIPSGLYHVTLKFLGDLNAEKLSAVSSRLEKLRDQSPAISLEMAGMSGFSDIEAARVVFVKVKRTQEILNLQTAIEQALGAPTDAGVSSGPQEQDFIPHLTLGRFRNPTAIKDMISPFVRRDFGRWPVEEIGLFSSEIQGPHVVHKLLNQISLRPL